MSLYLALLLSSLLAQPGEVQYSNGQITFARYSPIDYSDLMRRAGLQGDVKTELTIDLAGKITLGRMSLHNARFPSHLPDPSSLFFEPVREAVFAWNLVNETGAEVCLPLLVEFRFSGSSFGHAPTKNLVVLAPGQVRIRVTTTVPIVMP